MANEKDNNQPSTTPATPNPQPGQPDNKNQIPEFPQNEFVRGDFGETRPVTIIKRRD